MLLLLLLRCCFCGPLHLIEGDVPEISSCVEDDKVCVLGGHIRAEATGEGDGKGISLSIGKVEGDGGMAFVEA